MQIAQLASLTCLSYSRGAGRPYDLQKNSPPMGHVFFGTK